MDARGTVVVAVRAEKEISKTALAWCLTHVVRPGDCIVFLAVFQPEKTGRRFLNISKLTGDCGSVFREELPDRIGLISESYSQMLLQLHNQIQVKVRVKVVSSANGGAVVDEAKNSGASWVILNKKLKQELMHCMDNLRCNIVVMKGSHAKVVRLNLQSTKELAAASFSINMNYGEDQIQKKKHSTPVTSPDEPRASFSVGAGERLLPSSDALGSCLQMYQQNGLPKGLSGRNYTLLGNRHSADGAFSFLNSGKGQLPRLSTNRAATLPTIEKRRITQNHVVDGKMHEIQTKRHINKSSASKMMLEKFIHLNEKLIERELKTDQNNVKHLSAGSGVGEGASLGRTSSAPPPLCSFCQNKAPDPGKPPREFSYEEVAEATDGFSSSSLLAEGGFGSVYKGVLKDGQVVAVKLLKLSGVRADADFCREVQVLSCAHHRNVVLLIGFFVDRQKRILVYEYICNGSLELHLHGNKRAALDWESRLKIAIGAARGLRYLHQDCRVGCIVHRDLRPSNIILTHDYEALVADFGLARLHFESNAGREERVIGKLGYLARECLDSGIITPKLDVYAFGVVLLELLTGRRTGDLQWRNPQGELALDRILENAHQFLDPYLASAQVHAYRNQLEAVVLAASLCLSHDPDSRPTMSKVLGILEGGVTATGPGLDLSSRDNRSDLLYGWQAQMHKAERKKSHIRAQSH